jgi:hypothetical protein
MKIHYDFSKLNGAGKKVFDGLYRARSAKNTAWAAFSSLGAGTAALRMNESIARLGPKFARYGKVAAKARGLIGGTLKVGGGFLRKAGPLAVLLFIAADSVDGADGSEEFPELTGPVGSAATALDRMFLGTYVRDGVQIAASPITDNFDAMAQSGQLGYEYDVQMMNRLAIDSNAELRSIRRGDSVKSKGSQTKFTDSANSWIYRFGWNTALRPFWSGSFQQNTDGSWSTR